MVNNIHGRVGLTWYSDDSVLMIGRVTLSRRKYGCSTSKGNVYNYNVPEYIIYLKIYKSNWTIS